VSAADAHWFEIIWANKGVPVIASVALGSDGQYYNVNADQMASACAIACHAHALIFLTDVPGVRGADGTVIRWLQTAQIGDLVKSSVVNGGMLPKLEACKQAITRGVGRVRIFPAEHVEAVANFFVTKSDFGTEVMVQ
jgi:acetylglutamate kinase